MTRCEEISAGKTYLGIELGSTRIKAMLIDSAYRPLAQGTCDWENTQRDGIWTYSLEEVRDGVRACYAALKRDVQEKYGVTLKKTAAIGISAMMHGYLAFDRAGKLLVPFRTWRNTTTAEAAAALTRLFGFPIPQRWSAAHLYQAILNGEEHVGAVSRMTTLAGYVHTALTGENVLGIGDASGMFPVDGKTADYEAGMAEKFDRLLAEKGLSVSVKTLFPRVLRAGQPAGTLTAAGAAWLDEAGDLCPGIPFCPPEGDAGTGMTATNSVRVRTGNISAGTSVFAMVVLADGLAAVHPEIDLVATPDGRPAAMVHCNNCTSDLNAWADVFAGFAGSIGVSLSRGKALDKMFELGASGSPDCGGLCAFNCFSGEPAAGIESGRPLFVRTPDADFTVNNFMRAQLYGAVAALKAGMELLSESEKVKIDRLLGHGGYFKAGSAAQAVMADALDTPVSVMETAAEGGAYGMALLAAYRMNAAKGLADFLDTDVFAGCAVKTVLPQAAGVAGFRRFMEMYRCALPAERAAAGIPVWRKEDTNA